MQLEETFKEISIEYLQKTPVYVGFQNVISQLEKAEEIAYALATKDENDSLTSIKIGTALTFAVLEKLCLGMDIQDFSKEDWKNIAEKVTDVAILADGQVYTERVFTLYADYIDASVKVNKERIKDERADEIIALSDEIRELTYSLRQSVIQEADYVDRCLWISFEAMVKLLLVYTTSDAGDELSGIIVNAGDFAVQYSRYCMYKKENELLTLYLEHQGVLDDELEKRYQLYVEELEENTKKMNALMQDAFSSDFRTKLMKSAEMAREYGVDEEKILDSVEKVDAFFM